MNSHENQTKTCEHSSDVAECSVMETEQAFTEALRNVMQTRGLTIQALADQSGIKRSVLSVILNGHQSPTLRTIAKIANALSMRFVCGFARQPTKSKKRSA